MAPLFVAVSLLLSACANAPHATAVNDPYERENRIVHDLNKSLDRAIIKPISGAYGNVARGPISSGVSNFSANLSLPGMMLNDLLQLNLPEFFGNTFRFALNSTFGLVGLFDVAGQNGLPEHTTDFGETLFVWGVPEGAFIELPGFGASTERAAIGTAVDFLIDPTSYFLPTNQKYVGTAAHVLHKLGDRDQFSDIVESVLYESEDSYAQARILYLQSRRRDLEGELTDDDLEDPYAE